MIGADRSFNHDSGCAGGGDEDVKGGVGGGVAYG